MYESHRTDRAYSDAYFSSKRIFYAPDEVSIIHVSDTDFEGMLGLKGKGALSHGQMHLSAAHSFHIKFYHSNKISVIEQLAI